MSCSLPAPATENNNEALPQNISFNQQILIECLLCVFWLHTDESFGGEGGDHSIWGTETCKVVRPS